MAASRAQASDSQILVRLHRTQQLIEPLIGRVAPTEVHQVAPALDRDALPLSLRTYGSISRIDASVGSWPFLILFFAGGRQGGQIGA